MPGPKGDNGDTGTGQSADVADFTFTNNGDYDPQSEVNADSEISLHNKDFSITTTRDELTQEQIDDGQNIDADINITAADDIFITAQGDDAAIEANNHIRIVSDYQEIGNIWEFNKDGRLYLPNSSELYDEVVAVVTQESRAIDTPMDYLGNSPTNNSTAVYLEVNETSLWMANSFNTRLSSTITFGDSETLNLIAVYQINIEGTDSMVFQWNGSRDVAWPVQINQESNVSEDVASTSIRVPVPNTDSEFAWWNFASDGKLSGPGEGGLYTNNIEADGYIDSEELKINGQTVVGVSEDNVLQVGLLSVPGAVEISAYTGTTFLYSEDNGGVYLRERTPESHVATIGDIPTAPVETSFAVNGGSLGTQPTFDGAPLFTGSYVKTGQLVHFQIQVDMDNITSFGTGQYYVDLPLDAKYGYQFKEGCLHDESTSRQYALGGHVAAGTSRVFLTFTNSAGQDESFDNNSPVALSTLDNFHIAGTYITN